FGRPGRVQLVWRHVHRADADARGTTGQSVPRGGAFGHVTKVPISPPLPRETQGKCLLALRAPSLSGRGPRRRLRAIQGAGIVAGIEGCIVPHRPRALWVCYRVPTSRRRYSNWHDRRRGFAPNGVSLEL